MTLKFENCSKTVGVKTPIFIHSLFRSGSTWLFDRFRRSVDVKYWCYQEPFHESLVLLNNDPDALISNFGESVYESLRHPELQNPYFYEFFALRKYLKNSFQLSISYESFFDPRACPAFDPYVSSLIELSRGTPLLQCCRSFGRSAYIKDKHAGIHLYLWRNPWDQWWSYQINDYFETANLNILFAHSPPQVFSMLVDYFDLREHEIAFFDCKARDILRADQRYLLFYSLWLYGLLENIDLCDCLINIDRLSEDDSYVEYISQVLRSLGVVGIDLEGCKSPRSSYGNTDVQFFESIEKIAHQFFLRAGYSQSALDKVFLLREQFKPTPQVDLYDLTLSLERYRALALQLGNDFVIKNKELTLSLHAVKRELESVYKSRSWRIFRFLRQGYYLFKKFCYFSFCRKSN